MNIPSILIWALAMTSCNNPPDTRPPEVEEVFAITYVQELARASCKGDVNKIKELIANGVNPNHRGKDEYTPLLHSLLCQNEDDMIALLENGADPNQLTMDTYTPIIAAANLANPKFVEILMEHGGDAEIQPLKARNTALAEAFKIGFHNDTWDTYYYLLDAGVDPNQTMTTDGRDIATYAAAVNQYGKVIELIERGYDRDLPKILRYAERSAIAEGIEEDELRKGLIKMLRETLGKISKSQGQ